MQMNELNQYLPLLLEIGTEEIPARFLPDTCTRLKEISERIFSEYRIQFKSIKTYATPRRIVLYGELSEKQYEKEKEIWGPPVNVAFDRDGNPTKAAEVFARSNGIDISSLKKKEKGKGIYVVAVIKEGIRNTNEILPEILPKIILSLSFPKSMRWGNSNLRFARPIHWIMALYNNKKIKFEIDGIKSSNTTKGHRFLSPAHFEIKDITAFIGNLRNNFVIVDPEERKRLIIENAQKIASSLGAKIIEDPELLDHVVYLVEYPTVVMGSFPEEYLSLPKELLITVMKGHQKYFALEDKESKLINSFLIVSNTRLENSETVKKGAERVIKARFEDAKFYYESDKETSSTERLEGLKKVIYHDKLGSLYDKSIRIEGIAQYLAEKLHPEKKEEIKKAAILSKTDLISGVVGEFPELQGIMGSYYALNDGYSNEIALAISEQYLPSHSKDRLPETTIGTILSISDKLDNILSFFMLGLTPTGTEDPFALRRQALGIISMLIEKKYNISLDEIFDGAVNLFKSSGFDIKTSELKNELLKFFEQRIEPLFLSEGYTHDLIASISNFIRHEPLWTLIERLKALSKLKEDEDYEPFLLSIKRINNISPKEELGYGVRPELFEQFEERELYERTQRLIPEINYLLSEHRFADAIKALMTLKNPINNFFDRVLVMDKRGEIKINRLSLIKSIQVIASKIADFSKLL